MNKYVITSSKGDYTFIGKALKHSDKMLFFETKEGSFISFNFAHVIAILEDKDENV